MNTDIRRSIINNFNGCSKKDIIDSINDSINDSDEVVLPGLGVFFEILWKNSNDELKEKIILCIEKGLEH